MDVERDSGPKHKTARGKCHRAVLGFLAPHHLTKRRGASEGEGALEALLDEALEQVLGQRAAQNEQVDDGHDGDQNAGSREQRLSGVNQEPNSPHGSISVKVYNRQLGSEPRIPAAPVILKRILRTRAGSCR